jgi:hypothetical protein
MIPKLSIDRVQPRLVTDLSFDCLYMRRLSLLPLTSDPALHLVWWASAACLSAVTMSNREGFAPADDHSRYPAAGFRHGRDHAWAAVGEFRGPILSSSEPVLLGVADQTENTVLSLRDAENPTRRLI